MPLRIRVSTKAATFEKTKAQHMQPGYRIEDERPTPVNGMCTFTAVKEDPVSEPLGLTSAAVSGHSGCDQAER